MKIRLFIKPYCGWCHKAQRWLDERSLKYQTFAPVIEVHGQILADFGPEELAKFWEKL